jgi:hypothetical protein
MYNERSNFEQEQPIDIYEIYNRFKDEELYSADQVKSAYIESANQINYHINVAEMLKILENNMSLTCIVIKNDKVEVVWFFYGITAITILKTFDKKQLFNPTIHSKIARANSFTIRTNQPIFRYDVAKSESEVKRLLEQKLDYVRSSKKYTIQYLNEDDSQILGKTHRVEQKSFEMTRSACATINVSVKKIYEDNYTVVDFRINDTIKIQDKKMYKKSFHIRSTGLYPYDPNTFDILQITNLTTHEIYAIPMRFIENDIVKSTFIEEMLMKTQIWLTPILCEKYSKYKYDLKIEKDIRAYVATCEAAAAIPELTDRNFYKNMIESNADQFGSKKQLKALKENANI